MTIRGYIKGRRRHFELILNGYKTKDRMRLSMSFILSLLPKRFPNRLMILNRTIGNVIISSMNKLFSVYGLDGVLIADKSFENDISHWFKLNKDFSFVDIGANIGRYSILLSKKTNRFVYAFEPCKKTFNHLQKNIVLNKALNVISFNFGLSNMNKTTLLNITDYSGRNSIVLKKDIAKKRESINVKRFDDLIEKYYIHNIGLIKIDVEGYEWYVLNGMKKTLIEQKPRLIIEVIKENEKLVFDFLTKIGYQIIEHIDNDILAVHGDLT